MPSPVLPTHPIICDLQNSKIKVLQRGFIQKCVSVATSLGLPNGKKSSIYFEGKHSPKQLIQNPGKLTKHGASLQQKIQERETLQKQWKIYLQQQEQITKEAIPLQHDIIDVILTPLTKKRWSYTHIYDRHQQYTQTINRKQNLPTTHS